MGFVGNYAPCGLSPQTDGMPVIRKKARHLTCRTPFLMFYALMGKNFIFYPLYLAELDAAYKRFLFAAQSHSLTALLLADTSDILT